MDAQPYLHAMLAARASDDPEAVLAVGELASGFHGRPAPGDGLGDATPESQSRQATAMWEWVKARMARKPLAEACVPNKTGSGHHDDQTGYPCSPSGSGPASQPTGQPDTSLPDGPARAYAALGDLSRQANALHDQAIRERSQAKLDQAKQMRQHMARQEKELYDRLPGPELTAPRVGSGLTAGARLKRLPNGRWAIASGDTASVLLGTSESHVRRLFPDGIPGIDSPEDIATNHAERKRLSAGLAFAIPTDQADLARLVISDQGDWDGTDADGKQVGRAVGGVRRHGHDVGAYLAGKGQGAKDFGQFVREHITGSRALPITHPKALERLYPLLTRNEEVIGDEASPRFVFKPIDDNWAVIVNPTEADTRHAYKLRPLAKIRELQRRHGRKGGA